MLHHSDTVIGTASGVVLATITLPTTTAVVSTIILAFLGAVVGFTTTIILKYFYRKLFK